MLSRMDATGHHISWESDRKIKFVNPKHPANNLCGASAFVNGAKVSWLLLFL
jgi:hypothetical protein